MAKRKAELAKVGEEVRRRVRGRRQAKKAHRDQRGRFAKGRGSK